MSGGVYTARELGPLQQLIDIVYDFVANDVYVQIPLIYNYIYTFNFVSAEHFFY